MYIVEKMKDAIDEIAVFYLILYGTIIIFISKKTFYRIIDVFRFALFVNSDVLFFPFFDFGVNKM